jgi:hypothetical protein
MNEFFEYLETSVLEYLAFLQLEIKSYFYNIKPTLNYTNHHRHFVLEIAHCLLAI